MKLAHFLLTKSDIFVSTKEKLATVSFIHPIYYTKITSQPAWRSGWSVQLPISGTVYESDGSSLVGARETISIFKNGSSISCHEV